MAGVVELGYTGSPQPFIVPGGVTSLDVDLAGGNAQTLQLTGVPVTPGETLWFYIGGAPTFTDGGWNGGGAAYGSGGHTTGGWGASDIRQGGTALTDRIAVAAGRAGATLFTLNGSGGTYGPGDSGVITDGAGVILGPLPGPTDPPRVPATDSTPGYTEVLAGIAGGDATGADGTGDTAGTDYNGDEWTIHAGAGGGGWGGGASAVVYHNDTPGPLEDLFVIAGSRSGGWYAADGITAEAGDMGADEGSAVIRWAGGSGWSVGRLTIGSIVADLFD